MPVQPVADKPRGVDAVDERRRVLRDPGGEHDDFVVRRPERKSKAVEVKGRGGGLQEGRRAMADRENHAIGDNERKTNEMQGWEDTAAGAEGRGRGSAGVRKRRTGQRGSLRRPGGCA